MERLTWFEVRLTASQRYVARMTLHGQLKRTYHTIFCHLAVDSVTIVDCSPREQLHGRFKLQRRELLLRENGIITLCQVQVPFEEAFHSTDGMIVSSEGDFHCGINLFNHLL